MNPYHLEILEEIKKHAGRGSAHSGSASYLGSSHFFYSIKVPIKRQVAKEWATNHRDISLKGLLDLLDSLFAGKSYEEKTIAGILLGYFPKLREQIDPHRLDKWLDELEGWAEVDTLCQGTFKAQELLSRFEVWKNLLQKFSRSDTSAKRRTSLVLLTDAVSKSNDKRLATLAFENIDRLKSEKDILITKAISWLLRDLIKHHQKEVEVYINKYKESLPKIAVREATAKLLHGVKTKR